MAPPFSKFPKFQSFQSFHSFACGQKGRRPGSLREGCCPSDAVGAGSPPKGAEGETLEILKMAGAPSLATFSKFCPRPRGRGRQFKDFENGGHRPDRRFSKYRPRPLGGGGLAPNANSVQSGRARMFVRPTAMALTGSLTRREAVSSGLPKRWGLMPHSERASRRDPKKAASLKNQER